MNEQQRDALIAVKRAIEELLSQDEHKKEYWIKQWMEGEWHHAVAVVNETDYDGSEYCSRWGVELSDSVRRTMASMGYTEIPNAANEQISVECCGCRHIKTETCNRCYVAHPLLAHENLFERCEK
jgi:hypothetical protein